MFKFIYTIILLVNTIFSVYCNDINEKCVQKSPCLCVKHSSKLDISSVLDSCPGCPYLEDTLGNVTYYFFGCHDGKYKQGNRNITSSLLKCDKSSNCTSIGNAKSIKFEFADSTFETYQLVYNESQNVTSNYPTIRLICDVFPISFIKIINADQNELVLSSPNVCFITEHHGLSGGSIFLLIFFITVGVYFFGGALLLYFIRGARGVEMIPNLEFWKNLPGLVKDGAIFLFSGCRSSFVTTAETYDRI